MRKFYFLSLLLCLIAFTFKTTNAQTTITTAATGTSFWSASGGAIVFGVRNNNGFPINVTDLSSYCPTSYTATFTLWYNPTTIAGAPGAISSANGWTQVPVSTTLPTTTSAGIAPIFSGMSILIPATTTYRLALVVSVNGPYYGTSGSGLDTYSNGSVDILTQANAVSPTYTGPTTAPTTTPRGFYGSITFAPAAACTAPPTPGDATANNTTTCASSPVNLGLANYSSGTGQTYQWQSSSTLAGTYNNVGTSSPSPVFTVNPTATTYYRCAVTCGASTTYSTPISVTVLSNFSGGTYTINNSVATGGTNFQTFTDAFNAMSCGVNGTVIFNVSAGQTFNENPPVLNATGTSTNTITFQKFGTGANPLIVPSSPGTIASSTTIGSDGDAIITINGGDYITFDGIDLASSYSSSADMFEYGYYLKKKSVTDGCKNVTIKNATITLNKLALFSFGIFASNNVGTTVGATITSTGGRNENIKISGNTINNSYGGILIRGFAAASPYDLYDQNIEVGVDAANVISDYGGGATATYGIYAIYQNNLKIANNSITSVTTGQTAALYGVYATTAINANADIYNNTITITSNGTTTAMYALYSDMGGTGTSNSVNIYNNTITGCTYPTATTGSMYLIYIGGTVYKVNAYGNKLTNNIHSPSTTGAMYGLYQIGSTVNEVKLHDNFISGNSKATGTTGAVYWLYNNTVATATSYIYNDTITNNTATSTTGIIYGIYQAAGLANYIYKNIVSDLTCTATTTGGVYGITAASGTANTIYNNFISSLYAPSSNSTADAIRGINITSATAASNVNLYFNTIYLNATSSGTDFNTSGIYHTASTTATIAALTMKNNIVVNISTPSGTGYSAAYKRSSGAANMLNNFASASNNNLFYIGSPSSNNVVFYDGTNADQIISDYKARVSPREGSSISENPSFMNTSSAPYDLHINTSVATQIESGGVAVTGITDDFDGNTRNATTPDMGADEFAGIGADLTGPSISYTALPDKSICIEGKTITATINDASNVNIAAGTKPRLWFKKESNLDILPTTNTSTSNGWKWVEATNNTSPFIFNFNFTLLNVPLIQGDSVSYFIVAQDIATTPNVGVNIATFSNTPTSVALSTTSFPTSGNIKGFRVLPLPSPLSIKVSKTELCNNSTVTLDVDGVDVTGATYQWQSTHHNTNTWVDVSGGTTIPFTTPTITDSTDFRLIVKCGSTTIATSNTVSVNVNNPLLTSTTGATRCGTGTVNLSATAAGGYDIKWYSAATGGTAIGTGNTFTTPTINSTTPFYAAASAGGGSANIGLANAINTTTGNNGWTDVGLVFDALTPFELQTVAIYPQGTGVATVNIALKNSAGTILQSTTVNVTATTAPGIKTVVPINFIIPAGTGYRLVTNGVTGGISYLNRESVTANFSYPYTMPGVVSITSAYTSGISAIYYYYFYDWSVSTGCEGTRTAVTATVTTAPALTLGTAYKTICNNSVDSLSVTSTPTDYNTFVWSPTTDLFTDFACTVPYTGSSALKVYVKSVTPGKTGYKCTANNTVSFCANEATDTVVIMPDPTIAASPSELCISGTSTLSTTPSTGYGTGSLQWQNSANGTTYADITSATNTPYTTPTITATTYYKLLLKNSDGGVCAIQPTATVTVNSPQITSTTPGFTCGTGTVSLAATAGGGSSIFWYDVATGGTPLYTGSPFTTPTISTSTTYYVAAGDGGSTQTSDPRVPNVTTTTQNGGVIFTLNVDVTINSIDVFTTTGSGAVTVRLYDAANTLLFTSAPYNTVPGSYTTPQTIPLNWAVTAAAGYRILVEHTPALGYSSGSFPISMGNGVGTITGGALNFSASTLNYFVYNIQTTSGCTSNRTPVLATVNNDPGCIVPVTLTSFTGERKNTVNVLNWRTATELNNAGFELQRSTDGVNFSRLSFINSKAINGNSSSSLNYSFTDEKPLSNISYYRLKQIDKDGKSTVSNIVVIKAQTKLELVNIYPNPAKDNVNISLASPKADKITLIVTDIAGKLVIQKTVNITSGDNNLQLNVQALTQGSYMIKAICNDGCETAIKKFVKD